MSLFYLWVGRVGDVHKTHAIGHRAASKCQHGAANAYPILYPPLLFRWCWVIRPNSGASASREAHEADVALVNDGEGVLVDLRDVAAVEAHRSGLLAHRRGGRSDVIDADANFLGGVDFIAAPNRRARCGDAILRREHRVAGRREAIEAHPGAARCKEPSRCAIHCAHAPNLKNADCRRRSRIAHIDNLGVAKPTREVEVVAVDHHIGGIVRAEGALEGGRVGGCKAQEMYRGGTKAAEGIERAARNCNFCDVARQADRADAGRVIRLAHIPHADAVRTLRRVEPIAHHHAARSRHRHRAHKRRRSGIRDIDHLHVARFGEHIEVVAVFDNLQGAGDTGGER
jgi:hypothetical protein